MSTRMNDDGPVVDPEPTSADEPVGIDRRSFMMHSAMIGAVAVLAGRAPASAKETAERAAAPPVPRASSSRPTSRS